MSRKQNTHGRQDKPADANMQAGAQDPQSAPAGHGGKVANDTNQMGGQKPTQKNEGQRTPVSRHDRETHVGSTNQVQARRGAGGGNAGGH